MSRTISMEAAHRIWMAHREIEVGTKLLTEITETLERGGDPTPIDPFGRRKNFEFGVPSGGNSQRLLGVSNRLAVSVIRAHIAEHQRELIEATEMAVIELDAAP